MAIRVRKVAEAIIFGLVAAFNASRKAAVRTALAADSSADSVATAAAVTAAANGTDLATTEALANDLKAKYNAAVTLINELQTQHNALRATVTDLRSKFAGGAVVHYDVTELPTMSVDFRNPSQTNMQVTAADGDGTPATLVALANQCKAFYNLHVADANAHKVADGVNTTTSADATDLATSQTLLNELKGDFNAHVASTTYHANADTISVTAANATDQASADTLATQIKARINTHITSAEAGSTIRLVDA